MDMFNKLKAYNPDSIELEEVVALAAFGRSLKSEFAHYGLESPIWLDDKLIAIGNEIRAKSRDELERSLKATNLELEGLKSREERREDLKARQASLKAKLGQ